MSMDLIAGLLVDTHKGLVHYKVIRNYGGCYIIDYERYLLGILRFACLAQNYSSKSFVRAEVHTPSYGIGPFLFLIMAISYPLVIISKLLFQYFKLSPMP